MSNRHLELAPPPPEDQPPGPPSDITAERATLGGMLLSRHAIDDCLELVTAPEFYRPGHELIFNAIAHLHQSGEPVDPITVADRLTQTGDISRAGGAAYLHDLAATCPVASSAPYYAEIVSAKAAQRRLDATGSRIRQLANTGGNILELYTSAQTELDQAARWLPGARDTPNSTYARLDLQQALQDIAEGTYSGPRAQVLTRRDGKHLLYPKAVHSISGEPGSGKTWFALIACIQQLEQGNPVAFIDFEDNIHPLVSRLIHLGATPQQLADHFRYIRPQNALQPADAHILDQETQDATLTVIDGITEAMTINGLSPNDNDDVAKWLHLLPNRIADQGPAVLQIDHVVKNSEARGRYAIGGQHKLAGITGVAYKAVTVKTFARGSAGHTKIVIDKDKHGDVGPVGVTAADLHADATDPGGRVYAWLDVPGASVDEDGRFRPTTLMKRVSDALATYPGLTKSGIRSMVKGKGSSIDDAIDALIREGHIRTEEGPRAAIWHHLVEPFEDTK